MNNQSIPSNSNITETINAIIQSTDAATALLVGVNSSLQNISKIKTQDFEKNVKTFKSINGLLVDYIDMVSNIINNLIAPSTQSKGISEILGYQKAVYNPGGQIQIKEKYTNVESFNQINNILQTVTKSIDILANYKSSIKSILNTKRNIKQFQSAINSFVKMFVDTFTSVDTVNMKDILSGLCKEPDTITHIVKNDLEYEGSKDNRVVKTDKSITEDVTNQGRLGVLDAMVQLITIINSLNSLKMPSMLKFRINMMLFNKQLNIAIGLLNDLFKSVSTDENINMYKQASNAMQKISESLIKFNTIIKLINDISKKFGIAQSLQLQLSLGLIKTNIKDLSDFIQNDKSFQSLSSGLIKTTIDGINRNLYTFKSFVETLIEIGFVLFKSILIIRFMPGILKTIGNTVIPSIIDIANKLSKTQIPDNRDIDNNMQTINGIIENLIDLTKNITALCTSALPIIIFSKIIKLELNALAVCIDAVFEFIQKINEKKIDDSNGQIKIIRNLIANVLLIVIELIALTFVVIKFWAPIIIGMVIMVIILGLLMLTIKSISAIAKLVMNPITSIGLKKIKAYIRRILIIGVMLLALSLIAVAIVAAAPKLLLFFGVLTLILVATIGLGALITFASPVLGGAVVGLLLVGVMFGILIILSLELLAIGSMQLSFDAIYPNIDAIYEVIDYIAFGGKNEPDPKKTGAGNFIQRAGQFISNRFKSLADTVGLLGQMPRLAMAFVVIGMVYVITEELEHIQKQNIDTDTIQERITKIFGAVDEVITQINKEEKVEHFQKTKKNLNHIIKILKLIKRINKQMAKLAKQDIVEFDKSFFENINSNITNLVTSITFDADNKELKKRIKIIKSIKKILQIIQSINQGINELAKQDIVKFDESFFGNINSNIKNLVMSITFDADNKELKKRIKIIKSIKKIPQFIKSINQELGEIANSGIVKFDKSFLGNINSNIKNLLENIKFGVDNKELKKRINVVESVENITKIIKSTLMDIEQIGKTNIGDFDKVIDSYVRFIQKIQSTDISKLKQATSMFEQMAQFSKSIQGNFDGLADSLNEKIAPLLEELKDLMEQIPSHIDTSAAQNTEAISNLQAVTTGTPQSREQITQQVQASNPGISGEELEKRVDQKVTNQISDITTSIASKIDELKSLLKSGEVKIAMF